MYFTSKAPSSEIPRQKYVKKYQYEERYKPIKFHIYIEMIGKCKFQWLAIPETLTFLK